MISPTISPYHAKNQISGLDSKIGSTAVATNVNYSPLLLHSDMAMIKTHKWPRSIQRSFYPTDVHSSPLMEYFVLLHLSVKYHQVVMVSYKAH